MIYENFEQVKFVCEKIQQNETLLEKIKTSDEVTFRFSSGAHIKTIAVGKHAETDYKLDEAGVEFKNKIIRIIQGQIILLRNELSDL